MKILVLSLIIATNVYADNCSKPPSLLKELQKLADISKELDNKLEQPEPTTEMRLP